MSAAVRLAQTDDPDDLHGGGTVTYRVYVADRWVGDGRAWRGWRYGRRQWWAAWRQPGDTAARWNSRLTHDTRAAALTALLIRIEPTP